MLDMANRKILLLRYSNYRRYDFISCHNELAKKNGSVWMLKAGKQIPETSVNSVIADGGLVVLKAPKSCGGNFYATRILDFFNGSPKDGMVYPDYYRQMEKDEQMWFLASLTGSWFKIAELEELSGEDASRLHLVSNGKSAIDVLNSTRTAVMYVTMS